MFITLVSLSHATDSVTVTPKDGVTPAQIAAATKPIVVGTFTANSKQFTMSCGKTVESSPSDPSVVGVWKDTIMGTSPTCCTASATGVGKVGLDVASASGTSMTMKMAAMNMQFLVVTPSGMFAIDTVNGMMDDLGA